ncbi:MAG: sigma-54-dependent transcriptional regulator [Planctomycetota bacterium]
MRVLLVEDEPRFRTLLARALRAEGYTDVVAHGSVEDALAQLDVDAPDVVVTDLRLPGASGLDLLGEIQRRRPGLPVILMTAFADVETAREALKRRALDYLVKPFEIQELIALLEQVAVAGGGDATPTGDDPPGLAGMIGASPAMQTVYATIARFARAEVPVLIDGETGTGKELAARALHRLSERHAAPYVPVNVPAIPESVLESELFGHERGAFTGADQRKHGLVETAAGGTLFLDEVGELPLALQPKLLRFLQEHSFQRIGGTAARTVDVRIIAATNRDMEHEVAAGGFREDLYYRLDVARLHLPPLRERGDDILLLARHLLARRDPRSVLGDSAAALLLAHDWPGNVRELENAIDWAVLLAEGEEIRADHLPPRITGDSSHRDRTTAVQAQRPRRKTTSQSQVACQAQTLEGQERQLILDALQQAGGNRTHAAEILGITRRRLYSRFRALDIDPETERHSTR